MRAIKSSFPRIKELMMFEERGECRLVLLSFVLLSIFELQLGHHQHSHLHELLAPLILVHRSVYLNLLTFRTVSLFSIDKIATLDL
eukprot:IDg13797t1